LYLEYNYLDINPGSDDRTIIDTIAAYPAYVSYSPQKSTMRTLDQWAADMGIPLESSGDLDTHGPLSLPNILAFGMGLDPWTAEGGQMPMVTRDVGTALEAGTNRYAFYYFRDVKVLGVTTAIETSTDLSGWLPTEPVEENVLWDDGEGHHYVEAIFEHPSEKLFFQLNIERY
jgi:hypothetical protein